MSKNDKKSKGLDMTNPDATGPSGDMAPAPDGYVYRIVKGQPKLVKAPTRDNRPAEAIWADRAEAIRMIMQRQFDNLVRLGNAQNAKPTRNQEAAFRKWLSEESDRAIDSLFGHLHAEDKRGALLTSPDVTPGFRPKN